MQSAAKVGVLLTVFVVLLVGAFTVLGHALWSKPTKTFYAEFSDAAGLKVGTPVLMAGVKIGSVSEIKLATPLTARLTLLIDDSVKIPAGSTAQIPGSLIGLGDSPVSVLPPADGGTGEMPAGTTLAGRKASALDSILPNGKDAVTELTATMKAVRGVLEDKRLQHHVDDLIVTTNKTVANVGALTGRVDALLGQNQAILASALNNANLALVDVRRVTSQVAKMAEDPKLRRDALAILSSVQHTMNKVDSLVGDVGTLINDPKLRGPLTQSAQNVADMSETGKRVALNAEKMTANGAVISEKAIVLTDKVNEIASKASGIADDVKALTQRVSGILNPKPKPGLLSQLQVDMTLMRESQPGYWRTDFDATLPFQTNTIHFGLRDAFESNKVTFQLGSQVTPELAYRYGIFGGRAGVGVDYRIAPKISLRGDLWDLNNPRMDLRAGYDFGNGLIGWLGVDRVFGDNAASIGIGVRR